MMIPSNIPSSPPPKYLRPGALIAQVACAAILAFSAATADAQTRLIEDRFAFSPEGTYDSAIPSPADYLGYQLGTQFTLYSDVVSYLKALDAASNRITMHEYGRTYEGRPLHYLVVTSENNQARIEDIRQANLRLAGQALGSTDEEDAVQNQPVITWLSYNVHGNEASSTEAAMQLAYRLAAGQDANIERFLQNSVIILDPCINPDGRDRFTYWYRSMQRHQLAVNAADLEHDEPWPGGRTNHYWFDLNRDWVWLVHPESRGRISAYQKWLPQVHVDYHEQGYNNNYFTMPGTTPRNLLLPDDYEKWSDTFGRGNIRAFDQHQISYFTREAFDFFYPGYGSSYPSVMGAIGMLTEQGGHSRGGRAVETADGYVLTLRQRIFDHYTTSLAAIETAVTNRVQLLGYFRSAFSQSTNKSESAAYLFPDDPERSPFLYDVISTLLKHDVVVERADEAFTLTNARNYWDDVPTRTSFDEGTFIVRTDQPRHLFVNTVLQRNLVLEDSVTYDMASWSAPLAYNLDTFWTTSNPNVRTSSVVEAPAHRQGVVNPDARYGFVIDWRQRHAPRALAQLWKKGYRVRFARKSLGTEDKSFSEGSLIVLLGRNRDKRDSVATDMQAIAVSAGVEIIGMNSGRMASGIDLASSDSRPIKKPKVALLVDRPFSSYTAGQIWYLFDRDTEFGVTRLRANRLRSIKLSDYDVIVVPGGGGLSSILDSTQIARLKVWLQEGGTLVATESSAAFFTKERSGLTAVELAKDQDEKKKDEDSEDDEPDPAAYTTYAAREDSSGFKRVPGSALKSIVDTSHPLAAGIPERLMSLKFGNTALEPSESLQTVGYYDKEAEAIVAAGYASDENKKKLAGKAFAAVQPVGSGRVVFLMDNTQYRMFWLGTSRLMLNAVLLVPGM